MAGPPSYEPTVRDLVVNALPHGSRIVAGRTYARARVSWPLLVRASSTPEIEGGEVILAPREYADEIIARNGQLASMGVAAIVVERVMEGELEASLTIIELPPGTSVRTLPDRIERYVARSRRDLFVMSQEMHRALVEAALSGHPARAILAAAERLVGRVVFADLDGVALDTRPRPGGCQALPEVAGRPGMEEPTESGCLFAMPFYTGREQRGTVALNISSEAVTDGDEVLLASLASAMSIVAARQSQPPIPAVADILTRLEAQQDVGEWKAFAVDAALGERRASRELSSELEGRVEARLFGLHEGGVVVLIGGASDERLVLDRLLSSSRLGGRDVRVGVGRHHKGVGAARRSFEESIEALHFASSGGCVRFEDIELAALLTGWRWEHYAARKLAKLAERRDGDVLIETLRSYLTAGRNAKDAARAMGIHRNTMVYRLKRIEDCLERDLGDSAALFELELALRVTRGA